MEAITVLQLKQLGLWAKKFEFSTWNENSDTSFIDGVWFLCLRDENGNHKVYRLYGSETYLFYSPPLAERMMEIPFYMGESYYTSEKGYKFIIRSCNGNLYGTRYMKKAVWDGGEIMFLANYSRNVMTIYNMNDSIEFLYDDVDTSVIVWKKSIISANGSEQSIKVTQKMLETAIVGEKWIVSGTGDLWKLDNSLEVIGRNDKEIICLEKYNYREYCGEDNDTKWEKILVFPI